MVDAVCFCCQHSPVYYMSGSFESVWWNACVHILDLSLYSHPKEFVGNGGRTHVNSKGKIPSTGGSEEGQNCDAALRRTASLTHYRLSYSDPTVWPWQLTCFSPSLFCAWKYLYMWMLAYVHTRACTHFHLHIHTPTTCCSMLLPKVSL